MKINNWVRSYRYKFKDWFFKNITPKLPKIQTEKPTYPDMLVCVDCHKPPTIHAFHTGDGWLFYWDCIGQHISDMYPDKLIANWFPFLFGWATSKDLERIGIEVI